MIRVVIILFYSHFDEITIVFFFLNTILIFVILFLLDPGGALVRDARHCPKQPSTETAGNINADVSLRANRATS